MNEIINKKGIIPIVLGGLGNQLFVLAAAYVTHKNLNCPLYILENKIIKNIHNKYNLDYTKEVFKYFGEHCNEDQNNKQFINYLLQNGYKYHKKIECFHSWDMSDISPGLLMENYYQYYPPIYKYENDIRDLLIKGLQKYINNIKDNFKNLDTTAFIHIRRGDYVEKQHIHFLQPISYYKKCIDNIKLKNSKITGFIICSNDNLWVKEQEFFKTLNNTILWESDNELETLALMSLCTAGAICANSSFSWWGAFLGAHKYRNPVFMPENYFIDKPISLFPKEWYIIN